MSYLEVSPDVFKRFAATQTALRCTGAAPAAGTCRVRAMENPLTHRPACPEAGKAGRLYAAWIQGHAALQQIA